MGILYTISIVAFAALLWAVLSVARHIRSSKPTEEPIVPAARKPGTGDRPFLEPERSFVNAPLPREMARSYPLTTSESFITTRDLEPRDTLQTHDLPIHGVRRAPRPAPTARVSDRLDWAYFNKDLSNLKDPIPANHLRPTQHRPDAKQA
jgi:hypothetical protein